MKTFFQIFSKYWHPISVILRNFYVIKLSDLLFWNLSFDIQEFNIFCKYGYVSIFLVICFILFINKSVRNLIAQSSNNFTELRNLNDVSFNPFRPLKSQDTTFHSWTTLTVTTVLKMISSERLLPSLSEKESRVSSPLSRVILRYLLPFHSISFSTPTAFHRIPSCLTLILYNNTAFSVVSSASFRFIITRSLFLHSIRFPFNFANLRLPPIVLLSALSICHNVHSFLPSVDFDTFLQ